MNSEEYYSNIDEYDKEFIQLLKSILYLILRLINNY